MNTRNTPSAPEAMEEGRPLSTRLNGSFISPSEGLVYDRASANELIVRVFLFLYLVTSVHAPHFPYWLGHSTTESYLPS